MLRNRVSACVCSTKGRERERDKKREREGKNENLLKDNVKEKDTSNRSDFCLYKEHKGPATVMSKRDRRAGESIRRVKSSG